MIDIDKLTPKAKDELLRTLIEKLDELDQDDFFGTEGWEHYLGFKF
jgi:hypothetical protein